MTTTLLNVALPVPLRKSFDYTLPGGAPLPLPGSRVRVPFGKGEKIGIVLTHVTQTDVPKDKLKSIRDILDETPVLSPSRIKLLQWAAQYYHAPIGEVFFNALPVWLREGRSLSGLYEWTLHVTPEARALDPNTLKRSPKKRALLQWLHQHPNPTLEAIEAAGFTKANIRDAISLHWVAHRTHRPSMFTPDDVLAESPLPLNEAQTEALAAISNPAPVLLQGVTGSGKTEVYLHAIERIVSQGKQALVLVPEIALTPQTLKRFKDRFNVPVVSMHSGLTPKARASAWLHAHLGAAAIVIGTRSAVFASLPQLGLIVVDESHDMSFKQQEGQFRYSARDVAVMRAHYESIPIVLGTATPSSETLYNVLRGRYARQLLPLRAGGAAQPQIDLIDMRVQQIEAGCSRALRETLAQHLERGQQVLLFVNRRGYAPVLLCQACGWVAQCTRCDAKLTFHLTRRELQCHHCERVHRAPSHCPECQTSQVTAVGLGTQRLEEYLAKLFPAYPLIRIDSDSTRKKGSLEAKLKAFERGEAKIAIGTQMMAKGHHFDNLTCVAILECDSALYSSDFRATERMGQLITQVAGRAGRGATQGQVLIQSYRPDDLLLTTLLEDGYEAFLQMIMQSRKAAQLPPYTAMAVFNASALNEQAVFEWLTAVKHLAEGIRHAAKPMVLGPWPAPMAKRRGMFRGQLWIKAANKTALNDFLGILMTKCEGLNINRSVRSVKWNLDVDPADMF